MFNKNSDFCQHKTLAETTNSLSSALMLCAGDNVKIEKPHEITSLLKHKLT